MYWCGHSFATHSHVTAGMGPKYSKSVYGHIVSFVQRNMFHDSQQLFKTNQY